MLSVSSKMRSCFLRLGYTNDPTVYSRTPAHSSLSVEDGAQQREVGNVENGDLHGGQVLHVVLEGSLRLPSEKGAFIQ